MGDAEETMPNMFSIATACGALASTMLVCAGAAAGQGAPASHPDSAYLDAAQLGAGKSAGFLLHWFATELRGADEPALFGADSSRAPVVYRFVTLGAWGGARVLRLEQRAGHWMLVRKQTIPVSSWEEPERSIKVADSLPVPSADAERLVQSILQTDRWRRPAPACHDGLDGYEVLLEARDATGYSLVRCWVPDEATAPAIMSTMQAFEQLARELF